MTSDEFAKSESRRADLAAVLETPVLWQAIGVLLDELTPARDNAGVDNPSVAAARYQQIAGARHIVTGLGRLTQEPRRPVALTHKRIGDPLPKSEF